jgi:hypothetical protein
MTLQPHCWQRTLWAADGASQQEQRVAHYWCISAALPALVNVHAAMLKLIIIL